MANDSISFEARFSGTPHKIFLPIDAVLAIYARENGQGMMFAQSRDESKDEPVAEEPQSGPHLKLIK